MSKTDAWMPLFIGDYLADTMHLDAREHGAYLLLLMYYWRNGPLPDCDRQLAGIARVSLREWTREVGPIVRAFFSLRDGVLHQKRADSERLTATENSQKRRAAGRLGGDAKQARKYAGSDPEPRGRECPAAAEKPYRNAKVMPDAGGNDAAVRPDRQPSNATFLLPVLAWQNPTPRGRASPSPSPKQVSKTPSLRDAPGPAEPDAAIPEPAGPVPIAASDPRDARTVLFSDSLHLLRHMTGSHVHRCRSILGRCLRDLDDDASLLSQIIGDAALHRPAEPMAWIMAAVKARKPRHHTATRLDCDWGLPSLASAEMLATVEAVGQ